MATDDSVHPRRFLVAWSLTDALCLAFNFAASVGIIFINKAIFATVKFRFTTMLTAMHYVVTLAGLECLAIAGVYERIHSPTTPRLVLLSVVVGAAPAAGTSTSAQIVGHALAATGVPRWGVFDAVL